MEEWWWLMQLILNDWRRLMLNIPNSFRHQCACSVYFAPSSVHTYTVVCSGIRTHRVLESCILLDIPMNTLISVFTLKSTNRQICRKISKSKTFECHKPCVVNNTLKKFPDTQHSTLAAPMFRGVLSSHQRPPPLVPCNGEYMQLLAAYRPTYQK